MRGTKEYEDTPIAAITHNKEFEAIVLADEPTGNLDTATGEELFSLLRELNKSLGTTFLLATHNSSLASRCDRIVEMVDGRIRG